MDSSLTSEAAATLDARARAAARAREAARLETLARVRAALAEVLPHGARAWLIGSLVWGGFFASSDVDVVIEGLTSHAALAVERAVGRAGGHAVDMLVMGELPPSFRARVLAEGVAVDG